MTELDWWSMPEKVIQKHPSLADKGIILNSLKRVTYATLKMVQRIGMGLATSGKPTLKKVKP